MPRSNPCELVDGDIERRPTVRTRPQLHGGIDHQPDDVAFVALHLAHEKLPAPRARLPGDALERIAGHVLSELFQRVALAHERRGTSDGCPYASASAACALQRREERLGD